jgi:isoquinoline 1-oxidoreductase alpha subunit
MAIELTVNGVGHSVEVAPETPLLWVIRDQLGLTGTKFSCGIAQCGACTLHIDGRPVRSCSVPVSAAVGRVVTTIEGLSPDGTHPVQLAWIELDVPQCGYCQSGMIMSVVALLDKRPNPTDAEIDAEITNACRCSSYHRVRKAIRAAASRMSARERDL